MHSLRFLTEPNTKSKNTEQHGFFLACDISIKEILAVPYLAFSEPTSISTEIGLEFKLPEVIS